MKKVLPKIINYDQTAYVKNRYIVESIRVMDDILYHAEQENLDGILFAADMEKAFDSLEHNFIFSTLTKFGFGQEFILWVRTFLRNGSSCVMNNRVSTGYFNLEQGARQGDPLSPYLFILCLETLFIQIRNDNFIRGFKCLALPLALPLAYKCLALPLLPPPPPLLSCFTQDSHPTSSIFHCYLPQPYPSIKNFDHTLAPPPSSWVFQAFILAVFFYLILNLIGLNLNFWILF